MGGKKVKHVTCITAKDSPQYRILKVFFPNDKYPLWFLYMATKPILST